MGVRVIAELVTVLRELAKTRGVGSALCAIGERGVCIGIAPDDKPRDMQPSRVKQRRCSRQRALEHHVL
jgi:hypothetical protein